jgi:hypothetical protein
LEWWERKDAGSTDAPDYDEIVFPDEAVFEKVCFHHLLASYYAGQDNSAALAVAAVLLVHFVWVVNSPLQPLCSC